MIQTLNCIAACAINVDINLDGVRYERYRAATEAVSSTINKYFDLLSGVLIAYPSRYNLHFLL